MEAPKICTGHWVTVGNSIDAYVFTVINEKELIIGYLQNGLKAIKEPVEFVNGEWTFKTSGPSGSYLRGQEAALIKRGR
jgi:hypothetical protein